MKKVRILDLSLPLEESASELFSAEVQHQDHKSSVDRIKDLFGCAEEDLPQGLGWASDVVRLTAHTGTHVDAPWHYFPTSEGKKARTIDEMPLEWFYGDGVVLDMRHKARGTVVTVEDLEQALKGIGYGIKSGDIVLIQTGSDKYWREKEYPDVRCGMGRESTLWLIEHGVKVVGTDAYGWDRPFWAVKEEFQRTQDRSILWAAHRVGIEREFCQIEKMANLDKLPRAFGFTVACFPIKLAGGSGGWCRAVAIIEE